MNVKRSALVNHPAFPCLCALILLIVTACGEQNNKPPLSPADALKTFQLPDGFRIELVAAEPLISDPVEIAFDAEGGLYVAEMEDYPAQKSPGGRIVLLQDTDSDGYFETGKVFADSLPYVNGVMPWRNGVLVTTAPDILYLEDTDGDDRADIREVVLTGFAFTNPQLRMSSLRYGIDNWIYGAYSRAGGQRGYPEFANHGHALRFPKNPSPDSADIYPGTDFRFRPDAFRVEPAGGMSQFGLTFDGHGNRFTVWNNIHLRHVVIDGRYPPLNPALSVRSPMANISDHGDAATVYSRAENRMDLHESEIGHFTSACGHSIYTGDLFHQPYKGAAFVCEPVSNIVHIDILGRDGVTFSASRLKNETEFLTSTDSWFRPVNTTVGPDGGLYVVDFYRKLVEHPAWIARADDKGIYTHAGVLQEKDFLEGSDRGRIYRVVPSTYENKNAVKPDLKNISTGALVEMFEHPNMWWRINAQRLLVDRYDTSAAVSLKRLLINAHTAEAKIHALWTLDGLEMIDEELLLRALSDGLPAVRKQALLVSEKYLPSPRIKERILAMGRDGDPTVQFQLALTLSLLPEGDSFATLQEVTRQHVDDEWFHIAALLSARKNALQWFREASHYPSSPKLPGKEKFIRRIAAVVGSRQDIEEISALISIVKNEGDTAIQRSAMEGLSEGIGDRVVKAGLTSQARQDLFHLLERANHALQNVSMDVAEKFSFPNTSYDRGLTERARAIVLDTKADTRLRIHSARVLGLTDDGFPLDVFDKLLTSREPSEIQVAAARILIRREDAQSLQLLLNRWNFCPPEVRAVMERGFMRSSRRLEILADALDDQTLNPSLLSASIQTRLTQHPVGRVRQISEKVFSTSVGNSRESAITSFYEATLLKGNREKGRTIFRTVCSACHALDNVGQSFGPDLLSVSRQTRINLLTMIVDPNRNIAPGFDGYFVETTEGRTFTGIMATETTASVILRLPDGGEEVVTRDRIKNMRPLSVSLMPEGLETSLSTQDMADLLEYLKTQTNAQAKDLSNK